ncbi:MAG: phytoene/squalene synthase family protein [Candidatus Micrarchaeota archaeon]|nr:phytoene/squalene synthase family protein [Candidatus Micrarchaeota archaeon]
MHATQQDFQHCRSILKRGSKTFFFSSKILPRGSEKPFWAVYAFCRKSDDIIDEGNLPKKIRAERLSQWRGELLRAYRGQKSSDPVIRAFAQTAMEYSIPKSYPLTLLRGVSSDLLGEEIRTFSQLRSYCYSVASVVGLMLLCVMRVKSKKAKKHAINLGIAMQLTNIIRDVAEDMRMGRVYLPTKDLEAHGLVRKDIRPNMPAEKRERLRKLIAFECRRARHYYSLSVQGLSLLPKELRIAIATASALYSKILDKVQKSGHDVFSAQKLSSAMT